MTSNHVQSTRQLLEKTLNYPCLFRHSVNGTYYGIKKWRGKRKEHSLDTADRKLAERKLKQWFHDLDHIDPTVASTTVAELLDKFIAIRKWMSDSTQATETGISRA